MTKEDEIIKSIIDSFSNFGLGDIKHNINKPIAAFILCACLIDQLAVYAFKDSSSEKRWEKFIEKYLPKYDGLKMYSTFRCYLVHEYSLRGRYKITSETPDFIMPSGCTNITFIHIPSFIAELEAAFSEFKNDLENLGEVRNNALKWEKRHPIIKGSDYNPVSYNKQDANTLISYYTPIMKQRKLDNRDDLIFSKLLKQLQPNNHYLIFVIWKGKKGYEYCMEIEDAIKHIQLSQKQIYVFENK